MIKLKSLIPDKIVTNYAIYKEAKQLRSLPSSKVNVSNLRALDSHDLSEIFNSKSIGDMWSKLAPLRNQIKLPELKGGVNEGDQRAIYHLLKHLNAKKVLEIGTHIGASTAHICLALKDQDSARFVTVDIKDVNDPEKRPWSRLNSPYSPKELVQHIGGNNFTEFVVSPSLEYMAQCEEQFDFIFLDGDHQAFTVYREIPVALSLLRPGGLILLHDFFPGNKPLWSDGKVSPGTFLAAQRLIKENSSLDILHLGALPWETKLHSNFTSLAIVTTIKNVESNSAL